MTEQRHGCERARCPSCRASSAHSRSVPPPAPVAPQRATITIFEDILKNAREVLAAIDAARKAGVPDHVLRVFIGFDQLGQMRVEVDQFGDPRHQARIATYMHPDDDLASADVVIDDEPMVGPHPAEPLGLVRR